MDSTGNFALLQVDAILFNGLVELGCVRLIVFRSKSTQRFCTCTVIYGPLKLYKQQHILLEAYKHHDEC